MVGPVCGRKINMGIWSFSAIRDLFQWCQEKESLTLAIHTLFISN